MSKYAIQVENLGKEYIIGGAEQRHDSFREMLTGSLTAPFRKLRKLGGSASDEERFWALKDVFIAVERGQAFGLIGKNGAGKSTLLKVLSRITSPTVGRVTVRGRVASLLEVGTGFHPELTGRENIYLNGSILGMSRLEIDKVFEEIVDFAEVEKFLDTPVKRFSSGMYVRLAFSVAAHLEPDVLLVDEVLAVGDAAFQKKCLSKMSAVAGGGRTIIFVSHNLAAISSLCSQCILLQDGTVRGVGPTEQLITEYLGSDIKECAGGASFDVLQVSARGGDGMARLARVSFSQDSEMKLTRHLLTGRPLRIVFDFVIFSENSLKNLSVAIAFRDSTGRYVCRLDSELTCQNAAMVSADGRMVCQVESLTLGPGRYTFESGLAANGIPCDHLTDLGYIDIEHGDFFGTGRIPPERQATILVAHEWHFESKD